MNNNINIKFPFKRSRKGFFLDMNQDDISAIKSNLLHFFLTTKGERYYLPDFGTDLRKYIFSPNDSITLSKIKGDINTSIKKYIPNIIIDEISTKDLDLNGHTTSIHIRFTIQDGVFERNDELIVNF